MKLAFVLVSLCFLDIVSMMPNSTENNSTLFFNEPLVTIPSLGQVRGSFLTSVNGRRFLAFRAIPYAKPPIGNLRFEDPVAADPWQGTILNATKEGSKCLQQNNRAKETVEGNEDCLFLNVYTHSSEPEYGFLKPVMVYIHGGSFTRGSGNGENDLYGPGHMMDRDVVLVTFNYRLAAFGFFSTGDAEAPGNYGLLDQSLALRWVRAHIGNFGGDPASVTIFGNSAGGASIEYQILSPHSKGLFDRAIAQSGSVFCQWGMPITPDEVGHFSKILAEHLNCSSNSTREMVNCLRYKDAKEIAEIYSKKEMVMGLYTTVKFNPRVDKERQNPFLPDEPKTLIQEKRFHSVPIIMGLTQGEASFLVASLVFMNESRAIKELKHAPEKYLPYTLEIQNMKNGTAIAKAASKYYFGDNPDYENQLTQFEHMISDYLFNKPVDDSAHIFSQYGDHPVYYYYYNHQGQYSLDPLFGAPPDYNRGVSHASELFLMFAHGKLPLISTPGDIKVSKLLIDLWTSFSKNGIPKSYLVKDDWVPLDPKVHYNYLRIEAENPEMVVNQSIPFHHRLEFWDNIYDTIKNEE